MDTERNQAPTDMLRSVFQLGIVVADLDEQISQMRKVFGLEPSVVMECDYPQVSYLGNDIDAKARIAKYDQFGVLFEFVEPSGDDSMWSDALKTAPYGKILHHVRFSDVDDNDAVTHMMAQRGVEMIQEGTSVVHPNCKFTFYDTQAQLGFVTEVVTDLHE